MIIREDNKDIERLVHHLSDKVVAFRNCYPNNESLNDIRQFYDEVVIPWMEEYQLAHQEIDDEFDESIKNDILDLINSINRILNGRVV